MKSVESYDFIIRDVVTLRFEARCRVSFAARIGMRNIRFDLCFHCPAVLIRSHL